MCEVEPEGTLEEAVGEMSRVVKGLDDVVAAAGELLESALEIITAGMSVDPDAGVVEATADA